MQLPLEENRGRIDRLRRQMEENRIDAVYLTSPTPIFYLTAFAAVNTERPAAAVIPLDGPAAFLGPRLEESHVKEADCLLERVFTYFDYPGHDHPMEKIAGFLRDLGLGSSRLWTDNPAGYGGLMGYRGPALSALLPEAAFEALGDRIEAMMTIKSAREISLLKESARWGDVAMELLVEGTRPGRWDVEVEMEASLEASRRLREAAGGSYVMARWGSFPVHAGFRGQVGPDSSIPHTFSTRRLMERGDVLGTGASAQIGGYDAELERALIIGPPTDEQARLFNIMVEAQDAAIDSIRPGVPCAAVDNAAFEVLSAHGVTGLAQHHTGHGRGLGVHEPPYLDRGNDTLLQTGMVLCVEPGLYEVGRHGFRHSDTLVVTDTGAERITLFPRDLDACTVS